MASDLGSGNGGGSGRGGNGNGGGRGGNGNGRGGNGFNNGFNNDFQLPLEVVGNVVGSGTQAVRAAFGAYAQCVKGIVCSKAQSDLLTDLNNAIVSNSVVGSNFYRKADNGGVPYSNPVATTSSGK